MGPLTITSDFLLANARVCAEASAYAYKNPCGLQTELAHACILECGNARVVAFRGSVNVRDWMSDFEFSRVKLADGAEVHHGFWDALISMQDVLRTTAGWTKGPVFITGHSLGGALAVLAAQCWERAGWPVQAVYTFGQPRVGNGKWAAAYDASKVLSPAAITQSPLGQRTFRIVNEEDIVCRVPGWLMGYRAVGQEVFLPSTGGIRINPSIWQKLGSDLIGTWLDLRRGQVAQLVDHEVADYQRRLALV